MMKIDTEKKLFLLMQCSANSRFTLIVWSGVFKRLGVRFPLTEQGSNATRGRGQYSASPW